MAINLEPYKLLDLTQRVIYKTDSIIYRKSNTISVLPKDLSKSASYAKLISEEIIKRYPDAEVKQIVDGNILKLKVISNGYGSIHIAIPKKTTPSVLRAGEAYELYFHSVLIDGVTHLKKLREEMDIPVSIFNMYKNLTLLITSENKKISIGPIKSADKVGQEGKKADITITLMNGKKVQISLKQKNFFSWGSAGTYDRVYSKRPMEILKNAIDQKIVSVGKDNEIIFPPNVKGIRVPATLSEIKKYAFGDTSNYVDYILIHAIKVNYNNNTNIIYMDGAQIYKNNEPRDLIKMQNDVYMVIYKISGNSTALRPYKKVSVMYVNRNHAYNAMDGSKYIDVR